MGLEVSRVLWVFFCWSLEVFGGLVGFWMLRVFGLGGEPLASLACRVHLL